jgi:hypothetical protein
VVYLLEEEKNSVDRVFSIFGLIDTEQNWDLLLQVLLHVLMKFEAE